ncbi:MAG: hypothetical protein ACYDAY_03765 [Candidatus Dormibacteria bacterium]
MFALSRSRRAMLLALGLGSLSLSLPPAPAAADSTTVLTSFTGSSQSSQACYAAYAPNTLFTGGYEGEPGIDCPVGLASSAAIAAIEGNRVTGSSDAGTAGGLSATAQESSELDGAVVVSTPSQRIEVVLSGHLAGLAAGSDPNSAAASLLDLSWALGDVTTPCSDGTGFLQGNRAGTLRLDGPMPAQDVVLDTWLQCLDGAALNPTTVSARLLVATQVHTGNLPGSAHASVDFTLDSMSVTD